MQTKDFNFDGLLKMTHSTVQNYGVPGLSSSLLGLPSELGTVRLLHCERDHQEPITPHSHRFDFQCLVLTGTVINRVWHRAEDGTRDADWFESSRLVFGGQMGEYLVVPGQFEKWGYTDSVHRAGDWYDMTYAEVHSIYFKRGTIVLFFEGPDLTDESLILQPYVGGHVIPTFKVEPWMFQKTGAKP